MSKFCHSCSTEKSVEQFTRSSSTRDGLCVECRDCSRSRSSRNYHAKAEERRASRRVYYATHREDCISYWGRRRTRDPVGCTARQMVNSIQTRTRRRGTGYDESFVTIPRIEKLLRDSPACSMCGVVLNFGSKGRGAAARRSHDNSPSLDRFIPELGYVEGNIGVLCHKCNTRKNDNTLASALLLVEYLSRNATSVGKRAA
jgi:hypothetical protein